MLEKVGGLTREGFFWRVRELGQFINHSEALILFYSVQLPGMLLFYPRAFALVIPSHWNILQNSTLSPLSPPTQSQ